MKELKVKLRKHYKALRLNMHYKKDKDRLIYENLIGCELYNKAEKLLIYVSSGIEVDTIATIEKALSGGNKK